MEVTDMSHDVAPGFMTFDWGHVMKDERAGKEPYGRRDALDRPIPRKGALKVWLDRIPDGMRAPADWVHVPTARQQHGPSIPWLKPGM